MIDSKDTFFVFEGSSPVNYMIIFCFIDDPQDTFLVCSPVEPTHGGKLCVISTPNPDSVYFQTFGFRRGDNSFHTPAHTRVSHNQQTQMIVYNTHFQGDFVFSSDTTASPSTSLMHPSSLEFNYSIPKNQAHSY